MKQYTADKHAQYTLQIATPIVTAVLIGLVWYFLAVLPHWLLWTLTAVLAAAALAVLGYSPAEIAVALKGLDLEGLSLEEIVRQALRKMIK